MDRKRPGQTNSRKLNFGCGKKILPGFLNVDVQKGKSIDRSFDFDKFPYPLPADHFDYILADNVIEHLQDLRRVMDELHRMARDGAEVLIKVPYYNCKSAHSFTHLHFFAEDTFDLLVNGSSYKLDESSPKFKIVEIKLIPTRFGKVFPSFVRKQASYIFGEVITQIEATLKAVK